MEKKCKKCGTKEDVNYDGMCKNCYEDSIVVNEMQEEHKEKNKFFSDNKNIAILILSILVIIFASALNNSTVETSANTINEETTLAENAGNEQINSLTSELNEAKKKITNLETNNKALTEEKEQLTAKVNSADELQKTIDEKNNYILNLEAQVGTLTAEKSQLEAQKGILEQQLSTASSKSSSSSSSATSKSTSYTVYITNTGSKYHRSGCSYLRQSSNAIDKNSAISQGYTACSRCNP